MLENKICNSSFRFNKENNQVTKYGHQVVNFT